MATGAADIGASRGGAAGWIKAAAGADAGAAGETGAAGITIAGDAEAITDGAGAAMLGTQAGVSASAGSDDRTEVPPSMLARLAREVSDARKNAACDSAMAR
jgi:hypothetical protein